MNIFVLDNDVELCAQYHFDKHVVKMPLETAQILSTVARKSGIDCGYKLTHANHPCVLWAGQSLDNWNWLKSLFFALDKEWQYRYGHIRHHGSYETVINLPDPLNIPSIGITKFVQAMPESYMNEDIVEAYRAYYRSPEKSHLTKWTNRNIPSWW